MFDKSASLNTLLYENNMPLNKEQFLNQFTRQALDERISLFVGAGASADVGYPSWHNLFKPLAKELGTTLDESTNYDIYVPNHQ